MYIIIYTQCIIFTQDESIILLCVLFDGIIFWQSIYEICTHTGGCCFICFNVWFWNKDNCDQSGMYETRKQILYKNEYVHGCSSSDPLGGYVLAPDPLEV